MVKCIWRINPQPEHDTRNLTKQITKILARHSWQTINQVHRWTSIKEGHQLFSQGWIIFHREITTLFQHDIHFHTEASCYAFCNLAHALLDEETHFLSKSTNSTIDLCCFSDNIVGRSCMERTKGNYAALDRINITTNNSLYLCNKVRSCYKSVIGLVWKGGMTSLTFESNEYFTSSCKKGIRICSNISYLKIWTDVEPIELIWQPISKGTILIHKHTTSFIFFSWLEKEEHVIFRLYLKHLVQETKRCCHMNIVTTSMHTTFMNRFKVKTCFLYNW